jgi:hypothetical protein
MQILRTGFGKVNMGGGGEKHSKKEINQSQFPIKCFASLGEKYVKLLL